MSQRHHELVKPCENHAASSKQTWRVVTQITARQSLTDDSAQDDAADSLRRLMASLIVRQIRISQVVLLRDSSDDRGNIRGWLEGFSSQSKDAPKLVDFNDTLLDCDVNLSQLPPINKQEIHAKAKQAKAADRELRAARKASTTEKKPSPDCRLSKLDCRSPLLDCGLLLLDCQFIEGGK